MKWYHWVAIIAAIVATWFVRGCGTDAPDHTREKQILDSVYLAHQADSISLWHVNDSLGRLAVDLRDTLANTRLKLYAAEGAVNGLQDANTELATLVIATTDTGSKFKYCDSLAAQVMVQKSHIQVLFTITDTMIAQQARLMEIKDKQIATLTGGIRSRDTIISDQYKDYNALYKDYKSQVRQKKIGSWVARSLGLVVIILSGIILTK